MPKSSMHFCKPIIIITLFTFLFAVPAFSQTVDELETQNNETKELSDQELEILENKSAEETTQDQTAVKAEEPAAQASTETSEETAKPKDETSKSKTKTTAKDKKAKQDKTKEAAEKTTTSSKPEKPESAKIKTVITPVENNLCNEFTFDGTGSYDPDNEKITYHWDFGDGSTSTEPVVPHTYENSGDYKVILTVSDNTELECNTATTFQVVKVNIAPEAKMTSEDQVCLGETVTLDATESFVKSGNQLKYRWDLGDGSKKEGAVVKKQYDKGGNYRVVLTVDDNTGMACSKDTLEKEIQVNEPPVASAGEDVLLQCLNPDDDMTITFDASGTSDVNGDTLEYLWNFGDGSTGEGQNVSHTYKKSGKYTVTLTAKDDSGLTCNVANDTVVVNLSQAPKAEAGPDISVCLGDSVLLDGSKSATENRESLFSKWDFGDGSNERGLKVNHTYNKVGTYKATLSVENAFSANCPGSKDTTIVTVNSGPTVKLKAVANACSGQEVYFDATDSSDPDGDPLEFYWSFGDGAIVKGGAAISHVYEKGGNYKVSVVADDNKGAECSSSTDSIMVKINTPPVANAGPNLVCCTEQNSIFDGTGSSDPDGDELIYTWDFGDGIKASNAKVSHEYHRGGVYDVKLTVDDNQGTDCSLAESGFSATVNASPVPVMEIK